jgi:hypothetical protein
VIDNIYVLTVAEFEILKSSTVTAEFGGKFKEEGTRREF